MALFDPSRKDHSRPKPRAGVDLTGIGGWLLGMAILGNEVWIRDDSLAERPYILSIAAALVGAGWALPILERLRPPTGPAYSQPSAHGESSPSPPS